MTGAPDRHGFGPQASSSHISDCTHAPTVASLGLQVRLIPTDQDQERELARLIASCEILRSECERLFGQIVELLNKERCRTQDYDSPSPSLDL
jgi:hypothetical protein